MGLMMSHTATRIPLLDPTPEVEALWEPLNAAIQRVLRSGQFIMGPDVAAFEQEVAAYLGTKHAVACNSGTDALVLALRALGIGPGDEVVTTPFTFFATAESDQHRGRDHHTTRDEVIHSEPSSKRHLKGR